MDACLAFRRLEISVPIYMLIGSIRVYIDILALRVRLHQAVSHIRRVYVLRRTIERQIGVSHFERKLWGATTSSELAFIFRKRWRCSIQYLSETTDYVSTSHAINLCPV